MSPSPKLCRAHASVLVLVDLQQRLMDAMPAGVRARTIQNSAILGRTAADLDIPFIVTRQYPKGLGDTVSFLPGGAAATIDKTSFSCCRAGKFCPSLEQTKRSQVILAGVETHVCILQTAFDLITSGYEVFVVEDAVCSRTEDNHRNAIGRMARGGISITTLESTLFEWLEDARHPHFKRISQLIK